MFFGNMPSPFLAYRSIGVAGERIGIGVVDKSGVVADYTNRAYPAYVIVLILRGNGVYRTNTGESYALTPGTVFQRFRGVRHTTEIDPESRYMECFLELGKSVAQLPQNYGLANLNKPVLKITVTSSLVARFVELGECFRSASEAEVLRRLPEVVSLAWTCLGVGDDTEKSVDPHSKLISDACAFLGQDFHRYADLDAFCRRNGCTYENFRKLFKAKLGISPHRYRIRRRLDAALELLTCKELSIAEIAEKLNYASAYEFSAQFKRYMGLPPSGFRQ